MNSTAAQVQPPFDQDSTWMDYSTMYQAAALMGCKNGEIVLGLSTLSNPQLEEFFPCERSWPSSSSSLPSFSKGSPEYSSLLNNMVCGSFIPDPSKELIAKVAAQPSPAVFPPPQAAMQACSQRRSARFPILGDDDEAAITRAMMAVISSSSSSSYSSSPPLISRTPQEAQNHQLGAFKPYNLALAPKLEPKNGSCGQKMIKKSISISKRINWSSAEARSKEPRAASSNQLHHVISERRRREKLNGSFQELRILLPPGSKQKDKASVLTSTRNYLSTLKGQIYELEEKNRKLEMRLPSTDETQETTGSSGRVEVEIIKASDLTTTTELQHINFGLTVKAECDIISLVLHVLQCLKAMRLTSLLSVDAYASSSQVNLFARVNIKLQIKASDWNEELFKQAMIMAVDGMTTTSPSVFSTGVHT